MMSFFEHTFYDNSLRQWFIALAIAIGVVAFLRILVAVVINRLVALSKRTSTQWDDIVARALQKTKMIILILVGIYAGSHVLDLSDVAEARMLKALIIILWFQVGIWSSAGLGCWLENYRERKLAEDPSAATVVTAAGFIAKIVLWAIVLLLVLDNLGVEVTALIAGLGVGGIAIALAVQNILGDLLASLSIILDKPFVIGDFLAVGEHLGSVETIGLKTTRLRSLSGEQLVFSNNDLLASRIRNYGRMSERRVVFAIGVTYQTPREKLEKIPQILRESVEAQSETRFDRAHFKSYGDFSINFETVYYVLSREYAQYMDIQQAINLGIHERFEAEAIEFAYPTQTLHLVKAKE
jgi:small-conductance mechanosensitive channel